MRPGSSLTAHLSPYAGPRRHTRPGIIRSVPSVFCAECGDALSPSAAERYQAGQPVRCPNCGATNIRSPYRGEH